MANIDISGGNSLYELDRRKKLAQQLQANSQKPVQNNFQALTQILSGALGAYSEGKVADEEKAALAKALSSSGLSPEQQATIGQFGPDATKAVLAAALTKQLEADPKPRLQMNPLLGPQQFKYDQATGSYYEIPMGKNPDMAQAPMMQPPTQQAAPIAGGIQTNDLPPATGSNNGFYPEQPTPPQDAASAKAWADGAPVGQGPMDEPTSVPVPQPLPPVSAPPQYPNTPIPNSYSIPKPTPTGNATFDAKQMAEYNKSVQALALKNTPTAKDQRSLLDSRKKLKSSIITSLGDLLDTQGVLQGAIPRVNNWSAGNMYSEFMKNAGMPSDATDLNETLEPIRSKEAFTKLGEMKADSTTGASGLGPLAVKEMEALQKSYRSLNTIQDPEQLRKSMADFHQRGIASYEKIAAKYKEEFGEDLPPELQQKFKTTSNLDYIPEGSAGLSPAPEGLEQKVWDRMTEEQKKLWP